MRLRLEATPEELEAKGGELVKALAQRLADYDPELGEALIKASRVKDPASKKAADNLQFRVLREIKDETTREYKRQLQGMLGDIDTVLAGGSLRKAFGDPPEKPEPGEEPEEKPEPGEYDPKTDEIVPEPEEEDEEDEDEEEEKSLTTSTGAENPCC
jgi:hypothetical protein